jgi:hypothetical protein
MGGAVIIYIQPGEACVTRRKDFLTQKEISFIHKYVRADRAAVKVWFGSIKVKSSTF